MSALIITHNDITITSYLAGKSHSAMSALLTHCGLLSVQTLLLAAKFRRYEVMVMSLWVIISADIVK